MIPMTVKVLDSFEQHRYEQLMFMICFLYRLYFHNSQCLLELMLLIANVSQILSQERLVLIKEIILVSFSFNRSSAANHVI